MNVFGDLGQRGCKCLLYYILYFSVDLNVLFLFFFFVKTYHKRKKTSVTPSPQILLVPLCPVTSSADGGLDWESPELLHTVFTYNLFWGEKKVDGLVQQWLRLTIKVIFNSLITGIKPPFFFLLWLPEFEASHVLLTKYLEKAKCVQCWAKKSVKIQKLAAQFSFVAKKINSSSLISEEKLLLWAACLCPITPN